MCLCDSKDGCESSEWVCVCVCVTAAPTLEQLQVVIIHHPCKPVNPLKSQQS